MSKPIFVFVHGAWHRGAHFDLVTALLKTHGYKSICVDLPSVGTDASSTPPNADADSACIREAVVHELDQGSNVIVVSHSYGGIPTTSALPGLDPTSRHSSGHTTSVIALAPIASFILPSGMNVTENTGTPVSSSYFTISPPFIHLVPEKLKSTFYHDVPDDILPKYNALLKPMALLPLGDTSKHTAYEKIPVHYLFCDDDEVVPAHLQEKIVGRIERDGCGIRVEHVKASHSPFLSIPARVAEFLRRSAGENIPE